jgi:2-methylcitrate dehydratase PrpD
LNPVAERLARFALELRYEAIPADVAEAAKLHLLDLLGCGLAAHAVGVATEGQRVVAEAEGVGQATVIGLEGRLPAAQAAFANAMLGHGLDFDDTHADSICHVSVVVDPAALAVGEAAGAGGRETVAAIVAGGEIVTRLGMAASGEFHARGFHPTSVCGIFGATAAAARLGGLDPATATSALGLAGSMASGLLVFLADGSPTKPLHPAWAAHGAVTATRLAAHGAAGPRSVVEGRFGLFHAFLGVESPDLEAQLADLGERWETRRIAYKPYPACHMMHGVLGATMEATAGRAYAPDEVAEVVVTVPEPCVPIVLEPREAKLAPRTAYEAKFSLPYSVAALLVRGRIGVASYTAAALHDPDVLGLARRVRYATKPYPTYPRAFPGGVLIRLRDGIVLEAETPYQKGSPENPFSPDEVREKFRVNAALALPPDAVLALETGIQEIERARSLATVLTPLRGRAAFSSAARARS